MTGIVVVSHSRPLARAVAALAASMVPDVEVPIAYAGGVSGSDGEYGTDATDIMEAIRAVDSPDGVIVFLDMGSALLSTEMAIEMVEKEVQSRVVVSSAPIVEGTISAAVQVSIGAPLDVILAEAAGSLHPKQDQLDTGDTDDTGEAGVGQSELGDESDEGVDSSAVLKRVFSIDLEHGLHARPAARLVRAVAALDSTVTVSNLSKIKGPVSARSLNRLSTLEVGKDDEILVTASGRQAEEAIETIAQLIADRFGERDDVPVRPVRRSPDGTVGLSQGIAVGTAWIIETAEPDVPEYTVTDSAAESKRFRAALKRVHNHTLERKRTLGVTGDSPEAEIFDAHLVLLEDPDLLDATLEVIRSEKVNAEAAWARSVQTVVERYRGLKDGYLQIRATDVRDIGVQVLVALGVKAQDIIAMPENGNELIVVAYDLTPSQTVTLDRRRVVGIVTEAAGATSHTAILSRALGIPSVGGFSGINDITNGERLGVDGFTGTVVRNPDNETLELLQKRRDAWIREVRQLKETAKEPAVTVDGHRIDVFANVSTVDDLKDVDANGAEGIGLLRTEFLYVNRSEAPSMDEQLEYYSTIFAAMGDRPVTVRTFDVGGDKKIDYLSLEAEENPFLGVRGIRLYEDNISLFEQQLVAVLREAYGHDVSIMFPMIAKVDEFEMARSAVFRVHEELKRQGIRHKWPVDLGVMIETPASVLVANELAQMATFFSIGTNDLTQYVLAAERGSRRLSGFLDSFEPSVLRAVKAIVDIGRRWGVSVGVCGELGGQTEAVPLLVGVGVDKISANSTAIPAVKDMVRHIDRGKLEKTSNEIITTSRSAAEVHERLGPLVAELTG